MDILIERLISKGETVIETKNTTIYTVEREFLSLYSVTEFLSHIIQSHININDNLRGENVEKRDK